MAKRRDVARLLSYQQRMRNLYPDLHLFHVVEDNGDGTFQGRRPGWPEGSSIRIPVANGTRAVKNSTIRVGFEEGTKQRPFAIGASATSMGPAPGTTGALPPPFLRGIWTQAEGQPELAGSTLQGEYVLDWSLLSLGGLLVTETPPHGSYLHRGHVYWPAEFGTFSAISCWTYDGEWKLAVNAGYTGGARSTVTLGAYDIEDHSGLLSQGGAVYDGGSDHGGLGLHYSLGANALVCFGPLTHPEGRLHVYYADMGVGGAAVRSTLPKMAIHTSLGNQDVLIGWWGGEGSPSFYADANLKLLRFASTGVLSPKASVAVSSLTPGNWIYACHPNGTRARGRWPWRPTVVSGEIRDGKFAVAARSAQTGTVTFGGGSVEVNEGVYLPDPSTNFSVKTDQFLHLWLVSPNGATQLLYDARVESSAAFVNTGSFAWYEGNTPYPATTGYDQLQLGWPNDGDVRIGVYDADFGGDRVVHGPLLHTVEAPCFIFPMLQRNPHTRDNGNDVFEWVPTTQEQQPGGTFSAKGWHTICYAIPQFEIYGSPYFNAFFAYANPDWEAWRIAYEAWLATDNGMGGHVGPAPVEPNRYLEERWRMPRLRTWFRTYLLVHNESDSAVCNAEISQYLTGLRDGPVSVVTGVDGDGFPIVEDTYLDYEARPVLPQIYEAVLFGQKPGSLTDRTGMQAIAVLMDWRLQDTLGPSESRPVLRILDHTASAALIAQHELIPSLDRFDPGNAKFAKLQMGRPVLRHDLDINGWPFIEIYSQWRDRTSADDIIGDSGTHILRVTQLVWDSDHDTLDNAIVTHTDFAGVMLSEQELEGLAMVAGSRLVQTGSVLQGFQ